MVVEGGWGCEAACIGGFEACGGCICVIYSGDIRKAEDGDEGITRGEMGRKDMRSNSLNNHSLKPDRRFKTLFQHKRLDHGYER